MAGNVYNRQFPPLRWHLLLTLFFQILLSFNQIAVVSPASPVIDKGYSSGFASPIGSFRSRTSVLGLHNMPSPTLSPPSIHATRPAIVASPTSASVTQVSESNSVSSADTKTTTDEHPPNLPSPASPPYPVASAQSIISSGEDLEDSGEGSEAAEGWNDMLMEDDDDVD